MKPPHVLEAIEIIGKLEDRLNRKLDAAQKKIEELEKTVERLKSQVQTLSYSGRE